MATLTVATPALGGTTFAPVAAAGGGDKWPNPNGNSFLLVTNGSGSSITVTPTAVITVRPGDRIFPAMTVAGAAVSVGAGVTKLIGPFPLAFNDSDGNVAVAYSSATDVTVKPIQP